MGKALERAKEKAIEVATKKASDEIERILRRLERDTLKSISAVSVDTRNFGQLSTEIFLTDKPRQ